MRRQNVGLTIFLLVPVAVIVILVWAIAASLQNPPPIRPPAVGAGAGQTGGANALGESLGLGKRSEQAALIRPETLDQGFALVVTVATAAKTDTDSSVFVATNATRWDPGVAGQQLTQLPDGRWRLHVLKPNVARYEFKFTRGTWQSVEVGPGGIDISNRTLPEISSAQVWAGEVPEFEFTVQGWADQVEQVVGRIDRIAMPSAGGDERELLVWLPPGYDAPENAQRRYPVLYMHDGQNLFDRRGGAPGEWRFDETATRLIEAGLVRPMIVVGLPHGMANRIHEYLPPQVELKFQGQVVESRGDRHLSWLIGEVMPRVERTYRVETGAEHTGVGGSSLGGAISVYAAVQAPEAFGLLLAESLPPQTALSEGFTALLDRSKRWPARAFIGAGGREAGNDEARNAAWADTARMLDKRLADAGLGNDRRLLEIDPQAGHNEAAWASRLASALTFLFPPEQAAPTAK
ncbi:MAG: alpha/beta hydrolase [Phycisphaerales bacterium]|nr:alpha/beta hydrolase [Phycisphaerales bacterium]